MNEPKPRDIMSETPKLDRLQRAEAELLIERISSDGQALEDFVFAAIFFRAKAEAELTQAQADLGLERESHEVTKRMLDDADHELTEGRTKWEKDLELAAQAQAELRREKHAYDAAVNSHREYVRSIQAAVVDTIGGTVEGQPTHEGNYLQRLRELMTELTQAQARCAAVEKAAAEFIVRHDVIAPALSDVFTFYAVHGMKWPEADNWKRELDALRDALKEPR